MRRHKHPIPADHDASPWIGQATAALAAVALLSAVPLLTRPPSVRATSVAILGGQAAKQALIPIKYRTLAPDFKLTDVDGRSLSLASYRGKIVLLDFWGTTCGGCKVELPWYVKFDEEYRGRGLSLVGLDMYGENPSVIKAFAEKWHMRYPVAVGIDAIGDEFHAQELPTTILVDRKGKIAATHTGIIDRESFEEDIQHLLDEQ